VLNIARAGKCRLVRCLFKLACFLIVWHASRAPAATTSVLAAADLQAPALLHCVSVRTTCAMLHVWMIDIRISFTIACCSAAQPV
jgi:hypothetical protein